MKKVKKSLTAVAYVRKNLIHAAGDGSAIANQFQAIYDYASMNNIKIIKSCCDLPAAKAGMGPGLKQLMKEIDTKALKPYALICTDYNRFSRQSDKLQKVIKTLNSKKVKIIALNEINSDDSAAEFLQYLINKNLKK